MKIPRDVSGEKLAKLLKKYGCQISRQTGSHVRLTTNIKGEYHITIPRHKSLKVGTLNSILKDIANYLEMDKQSLVEDLFGKGE
jgi:predicted RNA binding protein YcfA (HicA-like mRNA interferase family)